MWSFITLARLFRAIRDGIVNRDFAGIVAAAKELADLLGFSPEAKELVELIASATAGDWAGTLRNLGEFLIVVSERFGGSVSIMSSDDGFDIAVAGLESQAGVSAVADAVKDQSNDAKLNPLPVILVIIQLIRLVREWRNKS